MADLRSRARMSNARRRRSRSKARLIGDAFATDAGASMRVRVERVSAGACLEPAVGGVSLTVLGALAAESLDEWRAGRMIRAMAVLRRPARYLNDGVPDQERMMARRGIALVGTVKSAALVHVVEMGSWIDETAAAIRAGVRRAIDRHVGSRDPQSAADRGRDSDRRSRRARSAGRAAPAGGRDVSRHRDLRRQYRHSRRPGASGCCGRSAFAAAGPPARRSSCWPPTPTSPAAAQSVIRATVMACDLSGAAHHRSADGAAARDVADARRGADRVAAVDCRCRLVADIWRDGGDCRGRGDRAAAARCGCAAPAALLLASPAAGADPVPIVALRVSARHDRRPGGQPRRHSLHGGRAGRRDGDVGGRRARA